MPFKDLHPIKVSRISTALEPLHAAHTLACQSLCSCVPSVIRNARLGIRDCRLRLVYFFPTGDPMPPQCWLLARKPSCYTRVPVWAFCSVHVSIEACVPLKTVSEYVRPLGNARAPRKAFLLSSFMGSLEVNRESSSECSGPCLLLVFVYVIPFPASSKNCHQSVQGLSSCFPVEEGC